MKITILSRAAATTALSAILAGTAHAEDIQSIDDLRNLSIEELAQIEVTSVSKRVQPVGEAPAAVYVITDQDIQRSAATSLPEVLRQAPNLQIQRIDARQFAISARGFNGYETANKMLALIDGRSIYTPLFSAIFWELHNPLLEDLAQIEVVSGPGGTLYGPNAVNGVINITTKDARETIGGLARATVAANEQAGAARYGFALGENAAARIYANYYDRAGMPDGAGPDIDDGGRGLQVGFRADATKGEDSFTLQGDLFDNRSYIAPGDGEDGFNILARWSRPVGETSSIQVQAYYDRFERRFVMVRDELETVDLQVQMNADAGAHDLVIGGGVRTTKDAFINNLNPFVLDPERKRLWVYNAFIQDEVAVSDALSVTAGVKLEQSSFSGLEILPNLRAAWTPSDQTLLWGAVSRAVRTPSRIDRELSFLPILAKATGFESETLTAFEIGYRGTPSPTTNLSVSFFYNLYDDIRTTEFSPGGALPIRLANGLKGNSYGVEGWISQQMTSWWRLRGGFSALGKDFRMKDGHVDITDGEALGNDPDYKVTVRSDVNLADNVLLDVGLRFVDDLERPAVPAYAEADARLSWSATDSLELFVAGSNLLHRAREESGESQRSQRIERSVHLGSRIRF